MTEPEARATLRAFVGIWRRGTLDSRAALACGGRRLDGSGELQGCRFGVEPVPGGVRVIASAGGAGVRRALCRSMWVR